MEPSRGCSVGSTTRVRLVPSASGLPGHSAACASAGPKSVAPKSVAPSMAAKATTLRILLLRIVPVISPHAGNQAPSASTSRFQSKVCARYRRDKRSPPVRSPIGMLPLRAFLEVRNHIGDVVVTGDDFRVARMLVQVALRLAGVLAGLAAIALLAQALIKIAAE